MADLPGVLVVDDEVRSLEALARTLDEEFDVKTASCVAEAEQILERDWIQIVLCDQRMPDMTGVEFLKRVREQWPDAVRIIISGYTEAEDIIAGVNEAGIYQYITKPWHPENLLLDLRNAVRLLHLQRENALLSLEMRTSPRAVGEAVALKRDALKKHYARDDGIVRAPDSPVNAVYEMVRKISPFDVSVLVTGESGTGKELLARALHYNSGRADNPFVVENCGALPDELLESELFGHKKGAFTGAYEDHTGLFEQADGGTIFLDEIGDVSPAFQVKLLRAVQGGEIRPLGSSRRRSVDVRVIAATNRNLETDVRSGRFREDLYYRLATVTVHLPPLRDRMMDVPVLAEALLQEDMKVLGRSVKGFTREALACIQAYHWPGNVRELRNEIRRMLVLAEGDYLGAELLSPRALRAATPDEEPEVALLVGVEGPLKQRLEALESRILRETLIRNRWNKSRAAQELGLSRVGLRSKLDRYGLEQLHN